MAFRRSRSSHRLFHWQSGPCMYHHRHSLCVADLQDRSALPMAIWFHIERHGLPDRLHSHPVEFTLADLRRFVVLPHAFALQFAPMPHAHRHSLGKTAFQDGRTFTRTVRQGCGVRILEGEDYTALVAEVKNEAGVGMDFQTRAASSPWQVNL